MTVPILRRLDVASTGNKTLCYLATCACPVPLPRDLICCRAAISHLLRMLDGRDPARRSPPPTPHGPLLAEYDRFLQWCQWTRTLTPNQTDANSGPPGE
jgi:hypothetical protein